MIVPRWKRPSALRKDSKLWFKFSDTLSMPKWKLRLPERGGASRLYPELVTTPDILMRVQWLFL